MLFAAAAAAPPAHRHHGPHVHGEAHANVGLDGQLLLIHLEAPGMSLLAFEHPPRDDAERAAYRKAIDTLQAPADWLVPSAAAGCRLDEATVEPHGFGGDASDGASDDADGHADFDVSYRYTCHAPLALRSIDLSLFERFPGLHKVGVDLVLPGRQGSQALTPGSSTVWLSE